MRPTDAVTADSSPKVSEMRDVTVVEVLGAHWAGSMVGCASYPACEQPDAKYDFNFSERVLDCMTGY